ncbi:triose-phosphate isomerase [Yoonia sp.]|uniref:triose-phosphate isomerase n=1 Tax=Yoonia sp. TaxID=2212373 RepID=UPI00391B7981
MRRKIAAGNWKMNGLRADLAELENLSTDPGVDVLICLPATLIAAARDLPIAIGGQDCHDATNGAHTGDISAPMLVDAGASYVLTGHSERRSDHAETDADIAAKSRAAHDAGLTTIICIGETLAIRAAGTTLDIIDGQLAGSIPDCATADNTIIAYEPVWAIGTGKVPSTEQIAEVHAHIHARLKERFSDGADFGILYGGSVKASNAADIFAVPHVTGALVGGASLTAADFSPIITALAAS